VDGVVQTVAYLIYWLSQVPGKSVTLLTSDELLIIA
jgi:hypothetical protein